ncbi:MAG: type I methionyl aminopeptidase, partial [Deltaproteobacteria bacterium]|nr:type I methionyl aminopeptidase [Deltaproteobacteria bacterium]
MGIQLKNKSQIAKLREANLVVADVLDLLEATAKPGMTTWELNEVAARRLKQLKAESAFLGYHDYPAVLCTSVNQVV